MLHDLFKATKDREIERILKELIEKFSAKWELVGGRPNFPTIHMTSSAVSAIIERITNAIDAQLEKDAEFRPALKQDCKSPRKLVERVYNVVGGYMSSLEDKKAKRENLVEETGISVTLLDGNKDETPTIDVLDKGIGIARNEFPKTILSLTQSNKINKWYLMGRFGQGGSTTYRFAKYTVIFSRRRLSTEEKENQISFTIVKYREASEGEKDGQYVYLVAGDRLPFSVSASNVDFDGGTLVRHVNYSLGKKYLLDVYGYMESYLFDPVLPFWLREERSWETNKGQGRRVFGSRDRLSRTDFVEQKDEFEAKLEERGLGTMVIRYWIFKLGTQRKEKLTFIDPDEPIVVTYLGQTHAKLPRRILANDCKLPNLYNDIVVQVDCDGLTDLGRRTVFTSTREVVTDEGFNLIRNALVNTLSDELADLDEKRQMNFLSEGVTKAQNELRAKLAEMINRIKPGSFSVSTAGDGRKPFRISKKQRKRSRRDRPPLETKDFPTYIRIANKQEPLKFCKAWLGTWIEIESDAPDDFLAQRNGTIELSEEARKFTQIAFKHKDFKGGRLNVKVGLIGDPNVGTTFTLGLRMHGVERGQSYDFTNSKNATVVEPPEGGGERKAPLDAPTISPVCPGDQFWQDNEWTDKNVAEVREGSTIAIYVSFGNKWLIGTLTGAGYTSTKQELLRNKYLLHMAFYAYLQNKGLKDLAQNGTQQEGNSAMRNIPQEVLDRIRQESLEWSARSILTAITSERAFSKAEAQIEDSEVE